MQSDSCLVGGRRLNRGILSIVIVPLLALAGRQGLLRAAPIERPTTVRTGDTSDTRPPEVIEAIKRFEGGDAEKAFALLKEASEKHPGLAPPRVMLANFFITSRQKAAGLEQLERAVVESPADPEAHLIFGDIAIFEGRVSDAEAQYKMGAALLTNYNTDLQRKAKLTSQYELGLASVEKLRGRWDIVQKQLNHLIEAQPQNSVARQRLAAALIFADKPEQALEQFRAAVKADPKLRPAPLEMADVYRQIGKSSEVRKWLLRAVQEAPGDVRARLALGDWWLGESDYDKAASEFAAAEKIAPDSFDVKLGVGTAARFQRDFGKARRYLEAAVEQSPGNFAASNQLALLIADQADKANPAKLLPALEIARSNLKSAPKSAEAESTLGWVLYRLGKLDEAERHLRAAMSSGSVSRDTAFYIAKLRSDAGQREESITLMRKAIESTGPFAHADEAARWLAQQTRSNEAPKK